MELGLHTSEAHTRARAIVLVVCAQSERKREVKKMIFKAQFILCFIFLISFALKSSTTIAESDTPIRMQSYRILIHRIESNKEHEEREGAGEVRQREGGQGEGARDRDQDWHTPHRI